MFVVVIVINDYYYGLVIWMYLEKIWFKWYNMVVRKYDKL